MAENGRVIVVPEIVNGMESVVSMSINYTTFMSKYN